MSMYSGDPKSDHSKSGNLRNPDIFDIRFSNGSAIRKPDILVRFSNGTISLGRLIYSVAIHNPDSSKNQLYYVWISNILPETIENTPGFPSFFVALNQDPL